MRITFKKDNRYYIRKPYTAPIAVKALGRYEDESIECGVNPILLAKVIKNGFFEKGSDVKWQPNEFVVKYDNSINDYLIIPITISGKISNTTTFAFGDFGKLWFLEEHL